ncbi:hypothetical protein H9P43_003545 [Blastocladiella emersonii ATCC 22665]|nr:hypothetical protein H9P43_003545 [Blastocladiella emersonii ATCC 22665]
MCHVSPWALGVPTSLSSWSNPFDPLGAAQRATLHRILWAAPLQAHAAALRVLDVSGGVLPGPLIAHLIAQCPTLASVSLRLPDPVGFFRWCDDWPMRAVLPTHDVDIFRFRVQWRRTAWATWVDDVLAAAGSEDDAASLLRDALTCCRRRRRGGSSFGGQDGGESASVPWMASGADTRGRSSTAPADLAPLRLRRATVSASSAHLPEAVSDSLMLHAPRLGELKRSRSMDLPSDPDLRDTLLATLRRTPSPLVPLHLFDLLVVSPLRMRTISTTAARVLALRDAGCRRCGVPLSVFEERGTCAACGSVLDVCVGRRQCAAWGRPWKDLILGIPTCLACQVTGEPAA